MKKVTLCPSGKEVKIKEGDTVLSALEKQGYALPNNCRAGACGECKIKVLSGEYDQGFVLDMALSQADREAGYGLMCMAKPKTDLEIEWGTEKNAQKLFPPKENLPYIVIEKAQVTPAIIKLRLRSVGESMRFWPGQYVTMGEKKRCYSIANIPNSEGELIFYITKVAKGHTSTWLHEHVSEGDEIKINGPYGTFIGDPSAETPVLCLAAGSGLAPIMSLASGALLRGGFKYPATILFSARSKEHLYDTGYFAYLQAKFKNFKFQYTLTREDNPGGLTGHIPDILASIYPDLSKHSIYIAGSTEFVDACKEKVKGLGAHDELIHYEGFFSQST